MQEAKFHQLESQFIITSLLLFWFISQLCLLFNLEDLEQFLYECVHLLNISVNFEPINIAISILEKLSSELTKSGEVYLFSCGQVDLRFEILSKVKVTVHVKLKTLDVVVKNLRY